jgi:hypothetical protein
VPPDKHGEFIHLRTHASRTKSHSMVLFSSVYRIDPHKTLTLRSQHASTGRLAPLGFTGVSEKIQHDKHTKNGITSFRVTDLTNS